MLKIYLPVCIASVILLFPSFRCTVAKGSKDEKDFVAIFDGKTLNQWDGDKTYWRVENGSLVGEVTPATILNRNSFIIWRGGVTKDFELKTEYRVSPGGNSGINYRSEEVEGVPYALKGYQADLDGALLYTGSNYEERGRTTLAARGSKVTLPPYTDERANDKGNRLQPYINNNVWTKANIIGSLGPPDSLKSSIRINEWNEYHLIVQGNHLRHYVNGVLMSEVVDNDTLNRKYDGLLGVQVHVGPPMKIEFRNMRLKNLTKDQ